jgi:hypothetical protein
LGHRRRLAILASGKSRPRVQTSVSMLKAVSKTQRSILAGPRYSPRAHLILMPQPALYASPNVVTIATRTKEEHGGGRVQPYGKVLGAYGPQSASDSPKIGVRQATG